MICECEEDRASCGGWNPGLRIWGSDSFLSSANMGISPTFCLCCGAACPTCPTAVFENKHKLEVDGFSRGKKTEFSSARSTHLICAARFGPEIWVSFLRFCTCPLSFLKHALKSEHHRAGLIARRGVT